MYHKTKSAIQLIISAKLSTRSSAAVCQQIYQNGTTIETPKQSGIYRATFKEATKFKVLKEIYYTWNFDDCLFDGKPIDNNELVLTNELRGVRLEALVLPKPETVLKWIISIVDECHL